VQVINSQRLMQNNLPESINRTNTFVLRHQSPYPYCIQ